MEAFTKGKKNRLNINDKVEVKPSVAKWYVEHFNESFLRGSDKEIEAEDYPTLAGWLHAHLTGVMPKGKITGYGSLSYGPAKDKPESWVPIVGQNCVKVEVKLKYGKYTAYFNERDVKRISK